MNTKFTPGPWEYDQTDRSSGAPEAIWSGGEIIARVEDVGGSTRANGRLIAAAPELLQALQYALDFENGMVGCVRNWIFVAREAIAKAQP